MRTKNTVIPDAAQRRSGIQLLLPWPLDDGSGGFRVCLWSAPERDGGIPE